MRIVGGTLRGRSFDAPEGRGTRPTTDRMRESIASMVLSACDLDLSDRSVLDAFAGSGGMGLELLSRGAPHCTFVERNRRAARIVRGNCERLLADQESWLVLVGDVMRHAAGMAMGGAPFGIVFLDPPYAMPAEEVSDLVRALHASGQLEEGCVVVYERAADAATLGVEGLAQVRTRAHGTTSVDLFRMEDAHG